MCHHRRVTDPAHDEDRGEIVWNPPAGAFATSQVSAFTGFAATRTSRQFASFAELLDWSIAEPAQFWGLFAEWAGVRWREQASEVLATPSMPGASWFSGATLNYAEQALAGGEGDGIALVSLSQTRERCVLTHAQLADEVARCAAGLRRLGVSRGDRVVALLPNIAETVVAFLATASLGAIWSSCAPEFGTSAVLDRWKQLDPVVVLTIDGYRYGSRTVPCASRVAELVTGLPTLEHVVALEYLGEPLPDLAGVALTRWSDFRSQWAPLDIAGVPFDHPLYVLFSSGTTGIPKAIVHGHGGMVVEHLKALRLHHDMGPDDTFMWFTTTGWMMWNYLVSGLLTGATVVLFDGDPGHPTLDTLWSIAADEQVSVLGVGAPFIMGCRAAGVEPARDFDLGALRQLGSTGSPLPAEGFRWVRDHVGSDVQLCSISGGTDVCTAFLGSAPVVPVRAGEISTRMLGCDVRAYDPDGHECAPGETGELVICSPMPSMPTMLWGDESGERLRAAYFERFPGVWHHGDWIRFEADGSCVITGRSDATLNRGGVRLGTAEFYSVTDSHPALADSIVVHLEDPSGGPGVLIMLIASRSGEVLDDDALADLRRQLRERLSPRHVPDLIQQFPTIPRTLTGKRIEVPVKRLLTGGDPSKVTSREALTDPAAFDAIATWAAAYSQNMEQMSR